MPARPAQALDLRSGYTSSVPVADTPTCLIRSGLAGSASATEQNQRRRDRRKGNPTDDKKESDARSCTAVIDGIVVRQCADHERALLPPITRRQLRLEIRPLSAGLGDRPRHGLREVVLDHAARRRRVRGLPGSGVDQPPVLVERRMGDPPQAFAHTGNLVSHHEAAGRELGGHAGRLRAAQVEHRAGPGLVQTRRVGRLRSAGSGRPDRPSCCARRSPGLRAGPARVPPWPGTWRGLPSPGGTCRAAAGSPRSGSPGPGHQAAPGQLPRLLRTGCACDSRRPPARPWPGRGYADTRPRGNRRCRNAPPDPTARHCRARRRPRTHGRVRRGSRWMPARSRTDPNPRHRHRTARPG